jgi:hypothetical protein
MKVYPYGPKQPKAFDVGIGGHLVETKLGVEIKAGVRTSNYKSCPYTQRNEEGP